MRLAASCDRAIANAERYLYGLRHLPAVRGSRAAGIIPTIAKNFFTFSGTPRAITPKAIIGPGVIGPGVDLTVDGPIELGGRPQGYFAAPRTDESDLASLASSPSAAMFERGVKTDT